MKKTPKNTLYVLGFVGKKPFVVQKKPFIVSQLTDTKAFS